MYTVYTIYVVLFSREKFFSNCYEMQYISEFFFCGSGRSNLQFFYLVHIHISTARVDQYECDDVLDGFWGP